MAMPVSSEFIELCEAQVELLSDALGAALCIVYLADKPTSNRNSDRHSTHFIPVIVRPEGASEWSDVEQAAWLDSLVHWHVSEHISLPPSAQSDTSASTLEQVLPFTESFEKSRLEPGVEQNSEHRSSERRAEVLPSFTSDVSSELSDAETRESASSAIAPFSSDETDSAEHLQIAVPLVYQGVMVGLLITARPDRFWTPREQRQIEQIAKTLTTAYVVDQRARWLKKRLAEQQSTQQALYAQQQDIFDDLLHQFRNPLTALRTFGKLLRRRLQPDDRNQDIAESIVRESDRLQDMLKQFKSALDEPFPLLLSASESGANEDERYAVQAVPYEQAQRENTDELQGDERYGFDDSASSGVKSPFSAIARSLPPADEQGSEANRSPLEILSDISEINEERIDQTASDAAPDSVSGALDMLPKRASSSQYLTGHKISRESCDWSTVLAPILVIAEAIAQEQDIELTIDMPSDLPNVLADPLGLREALSNLIDNALKYTPSGGHVRIQGGIESKGLGAIAIIDSGPGIPESDLDHLFERRYRGVQAQGNISGTGLGLAIAQDLLHQMGGEIEVFSPVCEAEFLPQWSETQTTRPGTAFVVWLEQSGNV